MHVQGVNVLLPPYIWTTFIYCIMHSVICVHVCLLYVCERGVWKGGRAATMLHRSPVLLLPAVKLVPMGGNINAGIVLVPLPALLQYK